MLALHLPKMRPRYMGAVLPSTDPVSVEATIDSYRRLGHKSFFSFWQCENTFRLLVQIAQVA